MALRWVPAHMPERAVREGRISRQDWLGNKLVDKLAGEASTDLRVPDELCRGLGTGKAMVKEASAVVATMFAACQVFDTNTSDAAKGNLMELFAIAIAVVGGTLMTGGFGSVLGVVFGAITVGLVANAVFFIPAIDGAWFRVFLGAILLAAVFANERIRKRITGGI